MADSLSQVGSEFRVSVSTEESRGSRLKVEIIEEVWFRVSVVVDF